MEIETYYQQAVGFLPNPLQKAVWKVYEQDAHPALLIRAGTGTGKTEASLLPALADGRRVVIVLPTKALIEDMGQRVVKIGENLSRGNAREVTITVDMGGSCRRSVCRSGESFHQNYQRHLFADDIIVTTLDKFLFRLFGYGEKIKSYIFPHRIFGSSLGKRPFLIFDEAHDYDGLAFSNFRKLLETLFLKGKDLCVMSATLPAEFGDFLNTVDATQGDLAEEMALFQKETRKMVHARKGLQLVEAPNTSRDPEEFLNIMERETRKRFDPARRIIVRTELVKDLVQLYGKLKDLRPLVYHGRLTAIQRSSVIQKLIARQREGEGFLILATSAIEAGCDLDAHVIVTELCNPDSLVQLAGRLNRRGKMEDAELVIVGDGIKPFLCSLPGNLSDRYLEDLKNMGNRFDPTVLFNYFRMAQGDWMGEVLFDMLWEYVYEGELTSKPLWDRGILVTRCWESSVTLCTGLHEKTKTPINPVQIGISRLARNIGKTPEELKKEKVSDHLSIEENGQWHAELLKGYYNLNAGEGSSWDMYPLGQRVSPYETSLFCVIGEKFESKYFDADLGYVDIPTVLVKGYRKGFERILQYRPFLKSDGRFAVENNSVKYEGSLWILEMES